LSAVFNQLKQRQQQTATELKNSECPLKPKERDGNGMERGWNRGWKAKGKRDKL